jgi:hypothetical protein
MLQETVHDATGNCSRCYRKLFTILQETVHGICKNTPRTVSHTTVKCFTIKWGNFMELRGTVPFVLLHILSAKKIYGRLRKMGLYISDANVHMTNSFLRSNFQFVLISKYFISFLHFSDRSQKYENCWPKRARK